MPPTPFRAIVLKTYDTGNTSGVAHLLSEEHGPLSLYVRGLRGARSRWRGILQPLALIEVIANVRDATEMATLRDASLLDGGNAFEDDLERLAGAMLLAEAATSLTHPGQPSHELFSLLLAALEELNPRQGSTVALVLARGLFAFLSVAGLAPRLAPEIVRPWPSGQPRPHCFWIDLQEGRLHLAGDQPHAPPAWPLRAPPGARHVPLPPLAVRFLYARERGTPPPDLPGPEAAQLADALLRLVETRSETSLKSASFWRGFLP